MLNRATPFFCTVRHCAQRASMLLFCVLIRCQLKVSGHGMQIKDTNGDESDGLDECSLQLLVPSRNARD